MSVLQLQVALSLFPLFPAPDRFQIAPYLCETRY